MAEPFDDAIDRVRRDIGGVIFRHHQTRFLGTGLGHRRRHHARQRGAAGDGGLNSSVCGNDGLYKIGIDEERRSRVDKRRYLRLVGGKRHDDGGRRDRACRQSLSKRPPHQRRTIVEQHQHDALDRGKIVGRQIRIEVGARQSGRGFSALAGRRMVYPLQEIANDHRCSAAPNNASPADARIAALTNRSP
jgi:hypothetical protein